MGRPIPVYGKDFEAGDILFTKNLDSEISKIISGIEDIFDDSDFDPSHVMIIQDDKWGIESAESGVKWCRLHPIWHENYRWKICRPPFTQEDTPTWIIKNALKYYGRPYDYTGLVFGFPLSLLTKLSSVIKPLRKMPVPLHLPGSFVCSAFVSQVLKDTGRFDNIPLIRDWNPTRITPAMLLREMPWRYTYEFNPISSANISDIRRSAAKPNTELRESPVNPDEPTHVDSSIHHVEQRRQGCGDIAIATHAIDGWKSNPVCAECSGHDRSTESSEG